MSKASDQITEYLSVGGLFNPEMMNQTQHEAVRDTLIKARDDIQSLERENAALREALVNADELERYSGSDGHRQWGKCSAWLHPDDAVVILSAKALDAARKEAQP